MQGTEKRLHEIKIRLTESELIAATKASMIEDRSIADFLHHGICAYLFGYAYRLPKDGCDCNESERDH